MLILAGAAIAAVGWTYVDPRTTVHVFAFGVIFARILERINKRRNKEIRQPRE